MSDHALITTEIQIVPKRGRPFNSPHPSKVEQRSKRLSKNGKTLRAQMESRFQRTENWRKKPKKKTARNLKNEKKSTRRVKNGFMRELSKLLRFSKNRIVMSNLGTPENRTN